MNKWIEFLKIYSMNLVDLFLLLLIYLILNYGDGGFTAKRFYLFFPFIFEVVFVYFTLRLFLYVWDGFRKTVLEEKEETKNE